MKRFSLSTLLFAFAVTCLSLLLFSSYLRNQRQVEIEYFHDEKTGVRFVCVAYASEMERLEISPDDLKQEINEYTELVVGAAIGAAVESFYSETNSTSQSIVAEIEEEPIDFKFLQMDIVLRQYEQRDGKLHLVGERRMDAVTPSAN